MTRIAALFKPPRFADEEKTRQAFLLSIILWTFIVISILLLLLTLLFYRVVPRVVLTQVLFGLAANAFLLGMVRRGYVRSASIIQITALWAFFTVTAWTLAGAHHQAYQIGYAVVISIAGFLLGVRGALIMVGVSLLSGGLMVVASDMGLWSFKAPEKALQIWVVSTILFPVLAILQYLAGRLLRIALIQSRTSQAQYRNLIDHIPQRIFIKDLNSVYVSCNANYARDLGIQPEQIVGKDDFAFHPKELAEIYRADDHAVMADEVPKDKEEKYVVSGKEQWIHTIEVPYRDDQGRVVGVLGIFEDITERKRAEQEMAILADIGQTIGSTLQINDVYEHVVDKIRKLIPFDSLTVNLCDARQDLLRVAYVSGLVIPGRRVGHLFRLRGTLTEEVIQERKGVLAQSQNPEDLVEKFPQLIVSVKAGMRSVMSVPLISMDKVIGNLIVRSKKPVAFTEQDLRLTEKIGMQIAGAIANAELFNSLSKTEKAVWESNELFSLFMRHSPIYAYIKEVTPTRSLVIQASDNYRQMIGIPGGEMVGKTMAELFPSEFGAKITADDWAVVSRGNVLTLDEELNGRSYTTIKFPIVRGDKTLLAGYTIDITHRKRAEEEKQNLEERLQRSEKMEALGQLAGGVAHDLNNVLGVLTGYSELLLGEIPEGQRTRGYAEKILQSAEKGAAIIQDLLTLARRGVTTVDVINLNGIVSDFLKSPVFERMKDYHPRVTFKTECDRNLLNIKSSPVHLEKTLMNLVSNAVESISGKGEVTIRTENRYLDKLLRGYDEVKQGDYVVLTVSDTGMGIPAENIEKIFEPFYTKKTMGRSGTGLGLAIVWGAVKDNNGYIDVQSEVGAGSIFTLYFPVTQEDLIAQQQKVSIEQYMGKGELVLVVDDIAEQRDIAARLLTQLGYHVRVVSSGEEAVEYLKDNQADVLVLDMIMAPGIDGMETYQRVLEINPKQKAIIVSGFSETERVRKAQELGAGAYVKKPYIMEKIGVAIRDELDGK